METEDDEIRIVSAWESITGRIMATKAAFTGCYRSNGGETDLGPPGIYLRQGIQAKNYSN